MTSLTSNQLYFYIICYNLKLGPGYNLGKVNLSPKVWSKEETNIVGHKRTIVYFILSFMIYDTILL